MTNRAGWLAAASLALGALCQSGAAEAQPSAYPPQPVAWIVGQGYSGYSGIPWPGPPWDWPLPTPRHGCYDFRQHLKGAWRRVEVCE